MEKILITVLLFISPFQFGQYKGWSNYTKDSRVLCSYFDGDITWIGTSGSLIKYNRLTDSIEYLDKTNSGLPSNFINCITIDQLGNKWIGTDQGLVKYENKTWKVYNQLNSIIPWPEISCLTSDRNGNIWVGTIKGLVKYNGSDWTLYDEYNSGLGRNTVNCIMIDSNKLMWIGTDEGIKIFNGELWKSFSFKDNINSIISIQEDKDGNIFLGTLGGRNVIKSDKKRFSTIDLPFDKFDDFTVWTIAIDSFNNKWFGTTKGLVQYDNLTSSIYKSDYQSIPDSNFNYIAIGDDDRRKIISTDKEIFLYETDYVKKINVSNSGMPVKNLYEIVFDKNGNKWFGMDNGLIKFNGAEWERFVISDPNISFSNILCLSIDAKENIWMGTDCGLIKFNGIDWKLFNTKNSKLPNNYIHDIEIENNQNIWIATNGGVARFYENKWTVFSKTKSKLISDFISSLVIDNSNNKWILTEKGLMNYDGIKWKFIKNSKLQDNFNNSVVIDSMGNIWIGSESGELFKYDGKNWESFNPSQSGLSFESLAGELEVDKSGRIWIQLPYGEGLLCFNGSTWNLYDKNNSGLPDNWIHSIGIDKDGAIWMFTNGGLSKFTPPDL